MNDRDGTGTSVYELRVLGLIPGEVLEALGDVATESASVSTVLSRVFADQAELLGFVTRLRTLGLEVVEVQRMPADLVQADLPPAEIGPDQPPG
jgi:hypothetical protein